MRDDWHVALLRVRYSLIQPFVWVARFYPLNFPMRPKYIRDYIRTISPTSELLPASRRISEAFKEVTPLSLPSTSLLLSNILHQQECPSSLPIQGYPA
jgi:hypothetical protein